MPANEVILRSTRRPGEWLLRWDDVTCHLSGPDVPPALATISTLMLGSCLERHALLVRRRVVLRRKSGNLASDVDPVAARELARITYPFLYASRQDDRELAAWPPFRRQRAMNSGIVALAGVAPAMLIVPELRSWVGAIGVGVGLVAWGFAVRAAFQAHRRRAIAVAIDALAGEGWPSTLPEGFGQMACAITTKRASAGDFQGNRM